MRKHRELSEPTDGNPADDFNLCGLATSATAPDDAGRLRERLARLNQALIASAGVVSFLVDRPSVAKDFHPLAQRAWRLIGEAWEANGVGDLPPDPVVAEAGRLRAELIRVRDRLNAMAATAADEDVALGDDLRWEARKIARALESARPAGERDS